METTNSNDFIAPIPHQIEADWHEKWGPLLVGFPLNVMYAHVHEPTIVAARYEPDLATFSESDAVREMTYRNPKGGDYSVRVVLHKDSGVLETFKYRGEDLVATASGHDFDSAMMHTTAVGIQNDELVTILR